MNKYNNLRGGGGGGGALKKKKVNINFRILQLKGKYFGSKRS